MNEYPHMCRDGHIEIGHADSSSEVCPLCFEKASHEITASKLELEVKENERLRKLCELWIPGFKRSTSAGTPTSVKGDTGNG